MKRILYCFFAALAFVSVSCGKGELEKQSETKEEVNEEQPPFYVYASFEDTKLTLGTDSGVLRPAWNKDKSDKVIGFDDNGTYTFGISSIDDKGKATFVLEGSGSPSGTLHLIYAPGCKASDISGKELKINFKRQPEQIAAIMLADAAVEGNSVHAEFHNACAIFGVEGSVGTELAGKGIARIILEGQNLSEATVKLAGGELVMAPKETSTETIRRDFEAVSVGSDGKLSSPIYIAAPAGAKVSQIALNDGHNNNFGYKPKATVDTSPKPGDAPKYYRIREKEFGFFLPGDVLPGVVTLNYGTTTKKVRFSKGNLQYQASTDTWRFAEHQWDWVGGTEKSGTGAIYLHGNVFYNGVQCDNNLISKSYSGWIDLFGWGTTGKGYSTSEYRFPYSSGGDGDDYGPSGKGAKLEGDSDWGCNMSNDYITWTTLEAIPDATYKYGISDNMYGPAAVNDAVGAILIPDQFSDPKTNEYAASVDKAFYFKPGTTKICNIYNGKGWEEMEKRGAVFLTSGGVRSGNKFVESGGGYWTTNANSNSAFNAYILAISYSNGSITTSSLQTKGRQYGLNVRLVAVVE